MKTAARKDSNHAEIVKALRAIGAHVQDVSQLKNCFDILVGYRGRLFIMEVKDGEKPPSARKLTDGELKCKTDFERVGVTYHIVLSVEQAIEIVTGKA